MNPFIVFTGYVTVLMLVISIIYYKLMDMDVVRRARDEAKELSKKANEARKSGNMQLSQKYTSDSLKTSMSVNQQMMKPMIVTMIIFFGAWYFFEGAFSGVFLADLPFPLPFLGPDVSWRGWYVIYALASGWTFRKLLGTI